MFSIFHQPYPRHSSLQKLFLTGFFFGTFVFLFLWFFRPFGISQMNTPALVFIVSGYGLVTAFTIILHGFLVPRIFRTYFEEKNWTVLKEIIQTLFVIFLIGLGNLIYSYRLGMFEISERAFIKFQLFTILVAMIPVTLMVMFQQIRLLKKNMKEAKKISGELFSAQADEIKPVYFPVQLIAENEKDLFTALSHHIFCILSADNYIEIVYSENNQIKRSLLRSSLKRAQTQLGRHQGFYRCHRTCIVNLAKVASITGNAQGYKLILENLDEQIPVSRNLNKEIILVLKDYLTGKEYPKS